MEISNEVSKLYEIVCDKTQKDHVFCFPSQTNNVESQEPSLSSPLQKYIVNKALFSWTKRMIIKIPFAILAPN